MDKETIIKGCENWVNNHKGEDLLLTYSSVIELLAVLKEQDAVKPFSDDDGAYWCGSCHEDIVWHQKFCSNCGRPVLWEGR